MPCTVPVILEKFPECYSFILCHLQDDIQIVKHPRLPTERDQSRASEGVSKVTFQTLTLNPNFRTHGTDSEFLYSLKGDVQILTPPRLSTERDQRRASEGVSKVTFQTLTLNPNLRTHSTDSEFLYSLKGNVQILTPPRLSTERDQRRASEGVSKATFQI